MDSPLYRTTGDKNNSDSFVSRHRQGLASSLRQSTDFQAAVIDYLEEWEAIVTNSVEGTYQRLVQQRKNIRRQEKKLSHFRKHSPKLEIEKAILKEMEVAHEASSNRLVLLLEAVVDRAWRDLFPVINHVMQLEIASNQSRSRTIADMKDDLVQLAKSFDQCSIPASITLTESEAEELASLVSTDEEDEPAGIHSTPEQ